MLSGGGARGFAHLGVLQALDELGIRIDWMSGTSAGALVGAFYCAGEKPADTFEFIREHKVYEWLRFLWRKAGLLNMHKVEELLRERVPQTFEELKIPLTVCTTDILKGEPVFFHSGPLIPAVCASASIPVMFEPVRIGDALCVDGGLMNNLPIEPFEGKTNTIIAVHVNPLDRSLKEVHFKDVIDRSIHLAISRDAERKQDRCTIFIEPPECSRVHIFDISAAEMLFDAGYHATMAMKEKLAAVTGEKM